MATRQVAGRRGSAAVAHIGTGASVFELPSASTVAAIGAFNESGRPNMMFAGTYVNRESAKLAHLLSYLVSDRSDARHLTFFANSALEAVSGAVKLARHTSVRKRRADGGWVLFVDRTGEFAEMFDPMHSGGENALVPRIRYVPSNVEAFDLLLDRPWAAVVADAYDTDDSGIANRLLEAATTTEALRVLLCTGLDPESAPSLTNGHDTKADVYVFGETLTGRQAPFGCFTMTKAAHAVWRNAQDSGAHTSTFGGNGVCLMLALNTLSHHGHIDQTARRALDLIDRSMTARLDAYRRHVNPHIAVGMQTFGFAFDVVHAQGAELHLGDGRVLLDCAGGTGANLRGHNPSDLVADVLSTHEHAVDYFEELGDRLAALTPFQHAYPAVSGATAVDTCLTLALLANPGKTRIVTLTGNYSGKTLPSMNLSKYGPSSIESDRDAFQPYYRDLTYIDPFHPDALSQLKATVSQGDVALVWFEAVQGMQCRRIPADLLDAVAELKQSHGYLVGIDEVLTGVWRTGGEFLDHQRLTSCVDLTSLAKPLSDMTVPIGVALASDEIHARARLTNPHLVERLSSHYRNQLNAHIACHALDKVNTARRQAERTTAQAALQAGLERVVETSRLFARVAGEGNHLRLVLRPRWFPFHRRSQLGQLVELAISDFILQECGVLVAQLRFFPAIFSEPQVIKEVTQRLEGGLAGRGPLSVYGHVAKRLATLTRAQLRSRTRKAHS